MVTLALMSLSPARNSRTRLATLDPLTRRDAASDFFSEENVPHQAITMGVGTIMDARKIVLIALGEHKAQHYPRDGGGRDDAARAGLAAQAARRRLSLARLRRGRQTDRRTTPWAVGDVAWTEPLIKRAVLWLCDRAKKALLKLDDDDFRRFGLHQLLLHHGPAQTVAHRVFRWMMDTINYHPAGQDRAA